jgi:hypothetical protein
MPREFHVILTETQYEWLTAESERTSVSASELVRRALDQTYEIAGRSRMSGVELSVRVWRRRIFGRRSGVAFDS